MTEYDFSPDAFERYQATQNRIGQWVGSAQRYPTQNPFMDGDVGFDTGLPYGDQAHYGQGRRSQRRGRSRYHDHNQPYQGRNGDRFNPDLPVRHSVGVTASANASVPPQLYNQNQNASYNHVGVAGTFPHPLDTRQGSIRQAMSRHPSLAEFLPLPEQYHPSRSQDNRIRTSPTLTGIPYPSSHHLHSRSMEQYPSPHIQVPISVPESDRFSRSSRSSSRDSYSTGSYSSRSSRSPSPHNYRTIHPYQTTPTVIQPSRTHPIVVPINGGSGGYVVIPAVGQSLQVLDPKHYKNPGNRSFLGQIFSPSKWGIRRKKY
ncbi:hypothetical protein BDZ97DRAFT_1920503 [Flammula alnicola]|nr:hypothetical protein BDZ97DRAFT_1920503 [Flammula alnicola]